MKYFFYIENVGDEKSPVEDFLESLPNAIEARAYNFLEHLADNQGVIDGVAFKKLKNYPLCEIRIKESKNLHRILYHVKIKEEIYVLHGFTKKEGMSEKEHKKLLGKEFKEAMRRYEIIVSAKSKQHHLKT